MLFDVFLTDYSNTQHTGRGLTMSDHILCKQNNGIATITFNKPEKLNALSLTDLHALYDIVTRLEEDKTCRVIILTGKGRAFISGADISELKEASKEHSRAYSRMAKQVYKKLECGRPFTIAAINGYALGGGLEMVISCDVRVAAESAKMGIPETSIGSIPGSGGTQRLPRLIGLGYAKEMMATAEKVPAPRAKEMGLVNHVVPDAELMDFCLKLAGRVAKNSTTAIAMGKKLMTEGMEMDIERAFEMETMMVGINYGGHDQREGMRAFMEKRKPEFE